MGSQAISLIFADQRLLKEVFFSIKATLLLTCLALIACVIGLGAAHSAAAKASERAASLREMLAGLHASYNWDKATKSYVFSDKRALDEIVSAVGGKQAVRALVKCMDDKTPSRVTLRQKPVPVGMVCYEGLSLVAYYEPTNAHGDVARRWDGFVAPGASITKLRKAKRAWSRVVAKASYKFL